MSTDAGRATLIRELRTAARGIDHSLADEPDYERFDRAIAAIENEAAQRAIDELLTVERVAAALHAACESWWESIRTANPDLLITVHSFEKHFERAAVLIEELRR